jgi:small subunit ribosomal protein S6
VRIGESLNWAVGAVGYHGRTYSPLLFCKSPARSSTGPEEVRRVRPYEIAVIFDVDTEENIIRETIDRIAETVRAGGGTPGRVDRWGRRGFAYEVKHRSEGYYVFVEVVSEPAAVLEVGRTLALADAVLRHRVIRQPDHVVARRSVPAPRTTAAADPPAAPPAEPEPALAVSAGDADGVERS